MKWRPIVEERDLSKAVNDKIFEIEKALRNIVVIGDQGGASLFNGHLGIAYFYLYFYKFSQLDRAWETAIYHIQKTFDYAAKSGLSPAETSYCDGLAGIVWGLNGIRMDFPSILEDGDFLREKKHLYNLSINEIRKGNYDYLGNGLGACLIALQDTSEDIAQEYLSSVVKELKSSAKRSKNGAFLWQSYNVGDPKPLLNLGLAHGIPSIISIISLICQANIEREECKELLFGSVPWLLGQQLSKQSLSLYSTVADDEDSLPESQYSSRMGWCYGDLGIAQSVWHAGVAIENIEWKEVAVNILLHSSLRRNLKENFINDACLCHGSTGIAHIFNRFYQITGRLEFKEAALYWIKATVDLGNYNDGIAGYKMYNRDDNSFEDTWALAVGLLEGPAGIGLALISSLSDITPQWDKSLLLS